MQKRGRDKVRAFHDFKKPHLTQETLRSQRATRMKERKERNHAKKNLPKYDRSQLNIILPGQICPAKFHGGTPVASYKIFLRCAMLSNA